MIPNKYETVLTSTKPPTRSPFAAFVSIAVPGILEKSLADALKTSAESNGLFNESHEGRLSSAGIEFVTWIGRSKMVYSSDPFKRKFCLMDICRSVSIGNIKTSWRPYVIKASGAAIIFRGTIANQTIWPYPIDVLHSTPGLLQHYLAQTGISRCGSAI